MNRDKIIRADMEFDKLLKEVKLEKIKNGTAKKLISDRRLTLAVTRIPEVRQRLIDSEISEEDFKT